MSNLPAEFASLEPHLGWALATERERLDRKLASSADEIQSFYDAMMGRIDEVLDHLDENLAEEMSAPDRRLHLLLLSLVEVSTLVERCRLRQPPTACDQRRFVRN